MYVLVEYDEHSRNIYPQKKVILKENDKCIVRHKGGKYEATFLMIHGSKEYLEKYAETLYPAYIGEIEENKENHLSLDLSNFSIGSELGNINSSSSMLETSIQDVGVEMDEFADTNSPFSMQQKFIQDNTGEMEDEESNNKLSESPTGFSDNSIDDPIFQPDEEECSSDQIDLADEPTFSNSKNNISNNLLEKSLDITINTCDDKNLIVPVSKASGGGEKMNVCVFCHRKQTKLSRHLATVHKHEDEVKKFKNLPKGCKERTDLIGCLRKKGNFNYNTKACLNDGNLIVTRRPNAKKLRKATDFLPCVKCKAFFSKNSLRVHFKACTGISSAKNRCVMISGKKIAARLHCAANKMVREKLFPPLREDEIVRLIRYDELVIVYANKMCEKYRNERYYEMIRQRLRLIGRFLKTLKEVNEDIQNLTDIFDPKYCQDAIKVINILAGANEDTGHFENPTVASSIGTLLKYLSKILINQCIISHDDKKRKNAKNFLLLFTQEIEINVTRTVTESQVHMRRQKTIELPLTSDIRKFYMYLRKNLGIAYNTLKENFDISTWLNLSEFTLLSIQVFNRRRPGELERILIEDFKKYEGINVDVEKDTLLSEESREMAKRYVRFLIRGKLNRTVPVILDRKQVQCIELLLTYRTQARIDRKNQYVFAVPGIKNEKYLRACHIMRKHAVLCRAEYPERLRGTKLRKHIATTCLKLNLEGNEVKDLANFMGHDVKIHKDIYRQPVASRDILRVSRLLEVAQGRNEDDEENSSDESEQEEPMKNPRKKRSTSPYGSVKRRRWNTDETAAAFNEFAKNITSGKLPSFKEIQEVKSKCPHLNRRSSPQIKTWIHNQFEKHGGK